MAQVFTGRFIGRLAVLRHMRTLICGIWTEFGFVLRSWNLIKMFVQYHALLSYPTPSSSCNSKIIINRRVTWFAPQITYIPVTNYQLVFHEIDYLLEIPREDTRQFFLCLSSRCSN